MGVFGKQAADADEKSLSKGDLQKIMLERTYPDYYSFGNGCGDQHEIVDTVPRGNTQFGVRHRVSGKWLGVDGAGSPALFLLKTSTFGVRGQDPLERLMDSSLLTMGSI